MGLLERLRAKPTLVPAIPIELDAGTLADAASCLSAGVDAGRCTLGHGDTDHFPVVGTQHRRPAVDAAGAAVGGVEATRGTVLPAVLIRDPRNQYDSNAIKVLIAGIHVGYVPGAEAKRMQPLLKECEKRDLLLVARAKWLPPDDRFGTGATLDVRCSLDGWGRSVALPPTYVREELPPRLLAGDELAAVVAKVDRLARQEETRRKQVAGLAVKHVRELLLALAAHAAALTGIDELRARRLADLLDQAECDADDLIDADDADEREDAHIALLGTLEDVRDALDSREE